MHDFNTNEVVKYDIMPYLMNVYQKCLLTGNWWMMDDPARRPVFAKDYRVFVTRACKHQYWSRCEYEWLMLSWPVGKTDTLEECHKVLNSSNKIDVWDQIEMNLDTVTEVFTQNIKAL